MNYSLADIAEITKGELFGSPLPVIDHLLIDSRKIVSPSSSLFFAISTAHRNGHDFIRDAYKKGVRSFVISDSVDTNNFPEANFISVSNTTIALQQLAAYHRQQFNLPVIGITGSNGKTIIKEWLYQLLHGEFNIVRSPKSYNSQIGVPLSVWQINEQHTLAIFEAGISEQEEMLKLEKIIQPTMGILSNIGDAHNEGFIDAEHKFREKLSLFKNCKTLIGRGVDFENRRDVIDMMAADLKVLTWGSGSENDFVVLNIDKHEQDTSIAIARESAEYKINIPFIDEASVENAISCFCVLLLLNVDPVAISDRMNKLHPVNMRLEMKKGINNCTVINDSYSADLSSLNIALNFLQQQSVSANRTAILSDFLQTGISDELLYEQIADSLQQNKINRVIGIGEKISHHLSICLSSSSITQEYFYSTDSFLQLFRSSQFKDETILVKGARKFEFEQITKLIEQKVHQTRLEINLNAIVHNLKEFQKLLKPGVKTMAMVKAYAYGSGGAEIAGVLQYHGTDYLGVAYADEGVELRKAGINLPIMVMNPDENSFDVLVEHNLEPEIFSFELLKNFDAYLQQEALQQYPIHLEIETGMNRLGFDSNTMEELGAYISNTSSFKIQSVFSHLATSDDASQDEYTLMQAERFINAATILESKSGYTFLKHIANSAAILRMPQLHLDMVRPGIGLYGIDSSGSGKLNLQAAATLKTTVAQIKKLKAGESVSYNRKTIMKRDSVIATVRIGYADGYPRRLGNGIGKMLVNGEPAPVTGTVCMDMVMLDISEIKHVKEGDEVIVFGKELPVEQVAEWSQTIPYEIMTGISQRVKRIYFQE